MTYQKIQTKKLTYAGVLLALGLVLPFAAAHGFGISGAVLLPMHIPVLLCGLICGPWHGVLLGIILPILNSALTSMPALYPMVPIMTAELAVYGLVSGILQNKTPLGKHKWGIYPSLIVAMVMGRAAYGLTLRLLLSLDASMKAASVWTAITVGLPGIAVQLVLLPPIVYAVTNHSAIRRKHAVKKAAGMIASDTAACVVTKEGKTVASEKGRGVAPIIKLYEQGVLEGTTVIDKVVGRAAAMVMTRGKIASCHAVTISESALTWLTEHGVQTTYDTLVPYIINRAGDGMCPMEQLTSPLDSDENIIELLKQRLAELAG